MLKTTGVVAIALLIFMLGTVQAVMAEGLIHRLPADGSWARYDLTGEGTQPDGTVAVTLKGTMTIKSVGKEEVEGVECRWIEVVTVIEGKRGNLPGSKNVGVMKLLIPEKYLVTGENPIAHVLKAWKQQADGKASQLDLKGPQAREVTSMEELFHATLAKAEQSEGVEVKVPGGTFVCRQLRQSEWMPASGAEMATLTSLTDEVPFGVASYRNTKTRKRGEESVGGRWLELKFAESGSDAKSEIDSATSAK